MKDEKNNKPFVIILKIFFNKLFFLPAFRMINDITVCQSHATPEFHLYRISIKAITTIMNNILKMEYIQKIFLC